MKRTPKPGGAPFGGAPFRVREPSGSPAPLPLLIFATFCRVSEGNRRKGNCLNLKLDVILGALVALLPRQIGGTQKFSNPSGYQLKCFFSSIAVYRCPLRPGYPEPILRDA